MLYSGPCSSSIFVSEIPITGNANLSLLSWAEKESKLVAAPSILLNTNEKFVLIWLGCYEYAIHMRSIKYTGRL